MQYTIRHDRFVIKVPTKVHPFNADFREQVIAPLVAAHLDHDVPMEAIRKALYATIAWFVDACAATAVRALPPHADVAGTESEVKMQAWVAVLRFDPANTPMTWPALLQRRLKVAPADAGRRDDQLPRQLRRFKRTYATSVAQREQFLGRNLTPEELRAVATQIAPATSRLDWADSIMHVHSPVATATLPEDPTDSLTERAAVEMDLATTIHDVIGGMDAEGQRIATRALLACGWVPEDADFSDPQMARRIRSAKVSGLDEDAMERLRECLPLERLQAYL